MNENKQHTDNFLKGLTTLTGIPYKRIQQYAKENNPFNILEHPRTIEPNEKQLEKIGLLNEFISTYNLLKIYEGENKLKMNSTATAGQYFVSLMGGMKDKERFMVAFLDNSQNIIETRTMSEGSVGQAVVYPREVLKAAIACDCRAIVLAHNHPGCSIVPSIEDRSLTQKFVDIFTPLDIKVLDHIIVGGSSYHSLAEQGFISQTVNSIANYEPIKLTKENSEENQEGLFIEVENDDEWEL
ncbi:MAG: DNA repair protein [Ruminiclostridium sp.]|nr:DNA repair protein [Ruminiclostridium sp.]